MMQATANPTYTNDATTVKNVCTGPGLADPFGKRDQGAVEFLCFNSREFGGVPIFLKRLDIDSDGVGGLGDSVGILNRPFGQ